MRRERGRLAGIVDVTQCPVISKCHSVAGRSSMQPFVSNVLCQSSSATTRLINQEPVGVVLSILRKLSTHENAPYRIRPSLSHTSPRYRCVGTTLDQVELVPYDFQPRSTLNLIASLPALLCASTRSPNKALAPHLAIRWKLFLRPHVPQATT
jgi:hypothetical protein